MRTCGTENEENCQQNAEFSLYSPMIVLVLGRDPDKNIVKIKKNRNRKTYSMAY